MRRLYILIFAIFVTAGLALYVHYSDEINVKSTHSEWAEITRIEQIERNQPKLSIDGTYTFWLLTVKMSDGKNSTIRVNKNLNFKLHTCVPVTVSMFYSNDTITHIDMMRIDSSGVKKTPCYTQET